MIELKNVSKNFGKIRALNDITLTFRRNKITAIVGPNGSGKTTLIKSILGLVKINKGEIYFDGVNTSKSIDYRNRIGYMPQIARYPENLRVKEVIELIMSLRNIDDLNTSKDLISLFKLEPYLDKFIRNLSGGTVQKISAVIAMMFNSDVYILDEPTAGLDPIAVVELKNLIRERSNQGSTFLIVSHLLSEIETYAERLVFMLNGKILIDDDIQSFIQFAGKENLEQSIIYLLKEQNYFFEYNGYNL